MIYEEAAPYYTQLRGNARALCNALAAAGYSVDQLFGGVPSDQAIAHMGTEAAAALAGVVTADVAASHPAAAAAAAALAGTTASVASVEAFLHGSVTAVLAAALVQVCLFLYTLNSMYIGAALMCVKYARHPRVHYKTDVSAGYAVFSVPLLSLAFLLNSALPAWCNVNDIKFLLDLVMLWELFCHRLGTLRQS